MRPAYPAAPVPRISTQPLADQPLGPPPSTNDRAPQPLHSAARGRRTTGSHVPHRSPDQARATSMPQTTWAVNGYPPGSSQAIHADPVLISSNAFRHVISGSLSLALLGPHLPRSTARLFCRRSARAALDRRTLRWFAASPRRTAAEHHRPDRPVPPSSMQHRISRFDLLYRSSSLRFVFTPWMPRLKSG